jgi:hypothetical protein
MGQLGISKEKQLYAALLQITRYLIFPFELWVEDFAGAFAYPQYLIATAFSGELVSILDIP